MRKLNMICLVFFVLFSTIGVSYSACEGDLNCDGNVDGKDVVLLAADYGTTGCGTNCIEIPLILSGSDSEGLIQTENSHTDGIGVSGKASGAYGTGVYGYASNTGHYENYGGFFESAGSGGKAVVGIASKGGNVPNYGGYFEADGAQAKAVYGHASDGGNIVSYGGYFQSDSSVGRAVYGYASNGLSGPNYGGYFKAIGDNGRGVYGETSGDNSRAVYGKAGTSSYTNGHHYGGYFEALGHDGRGLYASGRFGVTGVGAIGGYDFYAAGSGTNYGTASSIRWKQNIKEIDDALEKVIAIRGVYFDWDEEHGGQHDMGFIAEEVGEQIPEIVSYEKDGQYATGMDYGAITPVLLEAIKEQQEIIDQLLDKVSQIEAQLSKIRDTN